MSEILRKANFADKVRTKFRLHKDESNVIELELMNIQDGEIFPGQEQFSLMFKGPHEAYLPQQTYQLEHEGLGTLDLFLVPIGREQDGFIYEAAFSIMTE